MTETHDPFGKKSRALAPLKLAAAAGGLLFLCGLAFSAGWVLHPAEQVEVPRDPTADELSAACAPAVEAVADELTTAQTRVADLERESAERAAKVNELEDRIARGAEAGKALRAELAEAKAALAETQERLRIAEQEKERLLVELTETKQELAETQVELVETREERDFAREDALANRWSAFLLDAQIEICEKGNRKKLGACRETVLATLSGDARRDRFAHCIRSGQAQPMVHELVKDAALPQYGEMIDEEAKQTKGWYVEYCDPTLPERADAPLAENHLPATAPNAG